MARNKTLDAISGQAHDESGEIPEWARSGNLAEGVEETTPVDGVVASRTPALDALTEWLVAKAGGTDLDDKAGLESIVREALASQTPADVLRTSLPVSASNFLNTPMLLETFRIIPSEFEEGSGLPFYASMTVQVGEPPEYRVVNTSSVKVLAQLAALDGHGEWPQVVQLIEAGKAKKGQSAPLALALITE